ncbi:MAG: transketolase C-terminal domain-containing protein [Faecalibacterium sp.]
MNEVIAIRDAYGEALKALGAKNKDVVVLEADVGSSSKSILFGKEYPTRYFNVGIAELNMVSMAAGFASSGLIPFVNCFSVFLTSRGLDPIQSLIAYDNLNVKLCGTYCGLSDSYDGASHQSLHDLAVVRALPNMTVISVCDAIETKKAVEAIAAHQGAVYLRLSRAGVKTIHDESYVFEIGKGELLCTGDDVSLIATGYMVQKALEAADLLKEQGIQARVINMHTIQPLDKELVLDCAAKTKAIFTIEEHHINGGLGSAVAEIVAEFASTTVERIGLTDNAESGDYEQLLTAAGLDGASIAQRVTNKLTSV